MRHDADIIEQIIMDVEKYPEFLPWCSAASILEQDDNSMIALLEISFKGFKENYKSKVKKDANSDGCQISVDAISGPFRYLKNVWNIKELENGVEVIFSIDFEFKSTILDMIVGVIFSTAAKKMIAAFENRANSLCKTIGKKNLV